MMYETVMRPADAAELCDIVRRAAGSGGKLMLRGGGSKDAVGTPACESAADIVDMTAISGIIDYDPPELVLTAYAGTPVAEIEALLAAKGQMLAFAPWDAATALGGPTGRTTIGGTIAAGLLGSQRLTMGAVRDHLLGFAAVSGRSETFVAGAKVVKNVTGYDLPKLVSGSWGRLVALTEVTLKVLPRPETSITALALGLSPQAAMARLLGSQAEIVAAAHCPPGTIGPQSLTAVRMQGFAPSVLARCRMVEAIRHDDARFAQADTADAASIWRTLARLDGLAGDRPLWRVSLPARRAPDLIDWLGAADDEWLMDWGGAQVWYAGPCAASALRANVAVLGGHATLLRGDSAPAFHPQPPVLAELETRVCRAFDPAGVFETGRF